ncbi:MAG: thiol reductase thioredoxin [Anaerolineaceae bacterium]|nr:thiol reductase thioredoxin [Anaerolineaceae bacterium]
MSAFLEVSEETFERQVLAAELPVLLEFGAPWCNPCRRLEPILEQLVSREWAGKAQLMRVDVDTCPNLTMRYAVMTVPTLVLFIGGKPVQQSTGFQIHEKIIEKFGSFLLNQTR